MVLSILIYLLRVIAMCLLVNYVKCQQNLPEGSSCTLDGYAGTCVKMKHCYSLIQDFTDGKRPVICSFQDKVPLVCCTDCELVDDIDKIVIDPDIGPLKKNGVKAWDKCLDYLKILPYGCGNGYPTRLVKKWNETKQCHDVVVHGASLGGSGGEDAVRLQFPHMALLGYGEDLDTIQWLCGGSLISEYFILTAGHCTSSAQLGPVTHAALGILRRSDPPEYWNRYKIKNIIVHPDYHAPSVYNDIALLETETRVKFHAGALPACLALKETDRIFSPHATGWGALGHRKELADTLQRIYLEKFTDEECSSIYGPHRLLKRGYDKNTQICYGDHTRPRDTCEGDSGGPLQYQPACQYHIIGVTSVGRDCGFAGQPGMYTKVKSYVPWIESIVWP